MSRPQKDSQILFHLSAVIFSSQIQAKGFGFGLGDEAGFLSRGNGSAP
jgi:hypothetical protein